MGLLALLASGCGNGSGNGSGNGMTSVTISIGSYVAAAGNPAGTVPPNAQSMQVTALDGAGATIAGPSTVNGPPFILTFLVPTRAGIRFEVLLFDGLDGLGQRLFRGVSAEQTLTGAPITVPVDLNLFIGVVASAQQIPRGGTVALTGSVAGATPPSTSPLLWSATSGTFSAIGTNGATATWTSPAVLGTATLIAAIDPTQNPDQDPAFVGTVRIDVINRLPSVTLSKNAVSLMETETDSSVVATGHDLDNDPTTLHLGAGAPAWASISNVTGKLTLQPGLGAAGSYTIDIVAWDDQGGRSNPASIAVTVRVFDDKPPIVAAPADLRIEATSPSPVPKTDPSVQSFLQAATATDNVGVVGPITNDAPAQFPFPSTTVVTFTAQDQAGNTGSSTAQIIVEDTTPPTITPPADLVVEAESAQGTPAANAQIQAFLSGAVATDAASTVGAITHDASSTLPLGTTVVTFHATDSAGNTGTSTARITVEDTTPPVFTLLGADPIYLVRNSTFTDPGTRAIDLVDGDITASVQVSTLLDTSTPGTYAVDYQVADAAGNTATLTRDVVIEAVSTIDFQTATFELASSTPSGLAIADLDHDGALDIAVSHASTTDVVVEWGLHSGGFLDALVDAGTSTASVAAADLDHDGEMDLAVTGAADGTVRALWGAGAGTRGFFYDVIASTTAAAGIAVGDLDHDGEVDVMASARGSASEDALVLWGQGTRGFGPYPVFLSATSPQASAVAVADLDVDGSPDLVVADEANDEVSVFWGDGSRGFATSTVPVGVQPIALAISDLDHDGALDIAVATAGASELAVLWATGTRAFVTATVPLSDRPADVAASDLDRDGELDLFAPLPEENAVQVLRGLGGRTFVDQGNFGVGQRPVAVRAADLDRDGLSDLAVANSGSDDVSILFGRTAIATTLSFTSAVHLATGSPSSSTVYTTTADVDHDGNPDLITVSSAGKVAVHFGDGWGGFGSAIVTARVPAATGLAARSAAMGDLDHDGQVDLVVGDFPSRSVRVLLGSAAGTFSATPSVPLFDPGGGAGVPGGVALSDLNHDGHLDLGIAVFGTNEAQVALGTGTGDFGAFQQVVSVSGSGHQTSELAFGDLDHDGNADLVLSDSGANEFLVLQGFGDGAFASPSSIGPLGTGNFTGPWRVQVVDVDLDGNPDLISNGSDTAHSPPVDRGAWVLPGDGAGATIAFQTYDPDASSGLSDVHVADLNRDGWPDLVTPTINTYNLEVLPNDTFGGFLAPHAVVCPTPGPTTVADLNHDGKPDLVTADEGTFGDHGLSVILAQ